MNLTSIRRGRIFLALSLPLALPACGGGGDAPAAGDDTGDGGSNSPTVYACEGSGSVTVEGRASYEFVPAVHDGGAQLDYANSEFRPIRRAEVVAVCPDGSRTYDSAVTGTNGRYTLTVPEDVDMQVRVRASMQSSAVPSWDLRIVDNTRNQATWTLQGETIKSETGSVTVNLRARSGWDGTSYSEDRAAAPFAIMDSIYTAMQKVIAAEPGAEFDALKVNWSPSNSDCSSSSTYPFDDGCIGTSFYARFGNDDRNIFVLGDEGNDTDEYDNHVIIHEWGHYYEDVFARSDSIGGQHGAASRLDMRVAFGEGFGNAWSGIATDDPLYVDTSGRQQSLGFSFNVDEKSLKTYPGWWNESSIQEIIFDLYDGGTGDDDGVGGLGFAPLHAVLTNGQRNTAAATSIFPFIHFLKGNVDALTATAIDNLVHGHEISTISDEWGTDRGTTANDEGPDDSAKDEFVSPIYNSLGVLTDGQVETDVCGTNHFADGASDDYYSYNRIGARRFLTFSVPQNGDWLVTLDGTTGKGLGASGDPDFYIAWQGDPITADFEQKVPESGVDNSTTDDDGAGAGVETAVVPLVTGRTYLIETVEWLNVDNDPATGEDVCHDLSFELQ